MERSGGVAGSLTSACPTTEGTGSYAQRLIVDGIAAGAFQVDDPKLAAAQLFGALHSAFEGDWHVREMDDTERFVAAAQHLFHRAAGLSPKWSAPEVRRGLT